MDLYGHRYIPVSQFINYCRDFNLTTQREELDHYERECLMLPTARTIEPLEYCRARHLGQLSPTLEDPPPPPEEWSELVDDIDLAEFGARFPEPAHDHPFDSRRGQNPYLLIPDCSSYQPSENYRFKVAYGDHHLSYSREETYYSYWQVHQLALLQQVPDLYANLSLLRAIPDDHPLKKLRSAMQATEVFRTMRGHAWQYNLLSLWSSRRARLYRIALGRAQDLGGYKRIESGDRSSMDTELATHAAYLSSDRGFVTDSVLDFLQYLVELGRSYRRNERSALANAAADDARMCAELLHYLDGLEWADVGRRLKERHGMSASDSFLNLDPIHRSKSEARRNLEYIGTRFCQTFNSTVQPNEADEVSTFCLNNGIFEALDALSDFSYSLEESRASPYGFRFKQMRALALALEQFVRSLADKGSIAHGGFTLTTLIRDLAKRDSNFGSKAAQLWSSHAVNFTSAADCRSRLQTILNDPALQGPTELQVRNLLIACLARNASAHTPPTDWNDAVHSEHLGQMTEAIVFALIQLWRIARHRGWV